MTTLEKLQQIVGTLNPLQTMALPAFRWLLTPKGGFRSGRTHLLAVAILEAAIMNPGCEIPIFDHGPAGDKAIESTIKVMIEEVFKCKEDFVFIHGNLLYEPCEK